MAKNDHKDEARRRLQAEQQRFLAGGGAIQRVQTGRGRGDEAFKGPRRHDYLFTGGKTR